MPQDWDRTIYDVRTNNLTDVDIDGGTAMKTKLRSGLDWKIEDLGIEGFRALMKKHVDPTTSPGHPWKELADTNGQLFGYDPILGFVGEQVETLYEAVKIRLRELAEKPFIDDINLFIKDEPHKAKKLENEAYRLISGVGITDQMVSTIMFEELLEEVISKPGEYSTMIGWGIHCEEGLLSMNRAVRSRFGQNLASADKSSWDWTAQPWTCSLLRRHLMWLHRHLDNSSLVQMSNHVLAMLGPKSVISSDYKVFDIIEGGMASGWKLTILGNSWMQLILHHLAQLRAGTTGPPPLCMGDDTIQTTMPDEYWNELAATGCILKEVNNHLDGSPYEFCGLHFGEEFYEPSYEGKHSFLLRFLEPELFRDVMISYQLLYLFDPVKLLALRRWLIISGLQDALIDVDAWQYRLRGLSRWPLNPKPRIL